MIRPHVVPGGMMDDLAAGLGGPAAIDVLWEGQRSRRLLLLRLVIDRLGPTARTDAAKQAIIAADRRDPRIREILVEPLVGAWAAATVRAITVSGPTAEQIGHLGALAAVVSLRAGTAAEVSARTVDGWLYLPRLGRIRLPGPDRDVALTTEGGRLRIDGVPTERGGGDWELRRSVRFGDRTVALDDLDPYRDAYHVPAEQRLSAAEADDWAARLNEAWQVLTDMVPERAAEIEAGLHSLVPLRLKAGEAAHSATAREAVGVVGLDRPHHTADFVVTLVHEFQHSKLSALLDIVPLYDATSPRLFFAPWRLDPRPIGGLIQGVYAFLAVADTWLALARDPHAFPQAEHEFAEAHAQVSDALTTLGESRLLTAAGDRFLAGMRRCLERLDAADVSAEARRHGSQVLEQRRARWQSLVEPRG